MENPALFGFDWWTEPLGTWMAWTRATAAVFLVVFGGIALMGLREYLHPGGNPRRGILGLHTTRGDRLFLGFLISAFIMLGWLFFMGTPLWGGLALCLLWIAFCFAFV